MKVGFLFNHDALHQISHTAPVITELVRFDQVETVVLTSSPAQEAQVRALIGDAAQQVRFVSLEIGPAARLLDRALRSVAPFRRVATLRREPGGIRGARCPRRTRDDVAPAARPVRFAQSEIRLDSRMARAIGRSDSGRSCAVST